MPDPFFTIGHSTRSIPEFVDLLRGAEIGVVVDVRTVPRSRTNPQFNRETLPESLEPYQIGYEHLAALGGLRGKQPGTPSPNTFWDNDSFRNYADYALSREFGDCLRQLREIGRSRRTAIMCAEAVWWRCHRRIIADYLIAAGERVCHILTPERTEEARMTAVARVLDGGGLVYQRHASPG